MLFLTQLASPVGLWAQSDFQKEIKKVILIASTTEAILPANTELENYVLENGMLTLRLNISYDFLTDELDEDIHEELVVAARLSQTEDDLQYLLVDGYDRMDRSLAINV